MKKNKLISLSLLPYWEVMAGSRVDVFIDGVNRGTFRPSKDAKFYAFPDYVEYEDDELPI